MNSKNQIMDSGTSSAGKDLIDILNLLPRKGIVFITGSPGTGKSTFALNLIESELINNSSSATLIFSLERSPKELLDLMVRSVSEITGWKFDPKTLFGTKIARFKEVRNSLKTSLCSYATAHTRLKIYPQRLTP